MAGATSGRRDPTEVAGFGGEHDSEDLQGTRDELNLVPETPKEMVERHQHEDAAEETLDILGVFRELHSGEPITCKVYRIAGPNGEPLRTGPSEYCGELGGNAMNPQNLARLYGGGKYRVRATYSDGKFAGGRTIVIARDAKMGEEPVGSGIANMNAPASAFNIQEFLALQAVQDAKREEREERRRAQEKADRKELFLGLATVLGPVLTAMVGRPATPGMDVPALITALKPTPGENPRTALKDTLEMMVTMQGLMGGGGGGGSDTAAILSAVGNIAKPVLEAFAASKMSAPRVRQNLPRPPAPGAQPTVTPPTEPLRVENTAPVQREPVTLEMDRPSTVHVNPATQPGADLSQPSEILTPQEHAMFEQVKPQVEILVGIARNGGDPVETADAFFENALMGLPDAGYSAACDFLEHPKFLARAALFNSELKNFTPFFEAFQKRIVERIKLESGEQPPA